MKENSGTATRWQSCRETEALALCWQECEMVRPLWKAVWQFPLNVKHVNTVQPSNCTAGHFSQRNVSLCSHGNLYRNVCGSFMQNTLNLEAAQMSFNTRKVKQTREHPHYGKLLCCKEERAVDTQAPG